MTDIQIITSPEMFLAPGPARGFAFVLPYGVEETAVFSLAYPSRPNTGKQSLWTIQHGIHTEGARTDDLSSRHERIIHWVTVQVADPQVVTPFQIRTVAFQYRLVTGGGLIPPKVLTPPKLIVVANDNGEVRAAARVDSDSELSATTIQTQPDESIHEVELPEALAPSLSSISGYRLEVGEKPQLVRHA